MSFEKTFERFKLISGLSSQDAQVWSGLVREAGEYLDSLVVKEELFLNDENRLNNAAAVYSYYRYLCYTSGEASSFSAGDLSFTYNSDRLKAAEKMWENELKALGDLIDIGDSSFYFKRVE